MPPGAASVSSAGAQQRAVGSAVQWAPSAKQTYSVSAMFHALVGDEAAPSLKKTSRGLQDLQGKDSGSFLHKDWPDWLWQQRQRHTGVK